ncbi:2-hydroxyacid dehydrogenase [Microbacterium sp. ET2]|uniref:2-hydroxyacid dehydrogenase n=1 Tax=Microbacterium albipurpureum TaxID=3050384 RepID=UPI00259C94B5|nr:2-hydroxyacid dehydrogenase [Microbacterium sp. ET2 (Ac-2212)]WJL97176.1 2-hydroxyacid dehydrogenase [Microbacterium sp. ET2 (Ac-2212)]
MSANLVVSVPTAQLADDIQPAPDGVEVIVWAMDAPPPRPRIDIVVLPYMSLTDAVPLLDQVETQLVQSQSIGYDGIEDILPPTYTFANASSVHETSTAELAVTLALAAQRHVPAFVRAQSEGRWVPEVAASLADRRVLLLGYGGIGKAIEARLAGFEVELVRVASRHREEDGVTIHGVDELPELLPHADIVMASLPGGDATRHLIDDGFLRALPDGALVVNVGRGPLIDTEALVDHAGRGRIRAALDVTDPEPLPTGHPLWSTDGVLIVPHVGGASSAMRPRIARLVRRQIERMSRGEAPLNVVLGG